MRTCVRCASFMWYAPFMCATWLIAYAFLGSTQCVAVCCIVLQSVAAVCEWWELFIFVIFCVVIVYLCLFFPHQPMPSWFRAEFGLGFRVRNPESCETFSLPTDVMYVHPRAFLSVCFSKGWQRLIRCLKLQVIFRKRATRYRALLRKMTYEDEASYDFTPPCTPTPMSMPSCTQ